MYSHELLPSVDRRRTEIRHLDLPCAFTAPATKEAWEKRARALREHILVSMGLWPNPTKCPLNARITGRVERDGYSIENVYFESLPGFYVTGNLYRPAGADGKTGAHGSPHACGNPGSEGKTGAEGTADPDGKTGPEGTAGPDGKTGAEGTAGTGGNPGPEGSFPAVLNPHGHWKEGRLNHEPDGSIPARCINFALQGYVAFAWSMAGYNDSAQLDHRSFGDDRKQLWGLSLMGLQLWNGIRSIDFLHTLPEVDKNRIACTGASGGGTQTFMLTAVDDRVRAAAPVNMVSGHMQGGCVCENGPNLRIETNNMEIAALAAPRPLLLVSATGDWTVNTPDFEYPAIRAVYALYEAEDRIAQTQIDAGHNYNAASREAVYAWFGKWMLHQDTGRDLEDRPDERPADRPIERAANRPDDRTADRPVERTADRPIEPEAPGSMLAIAPGSEPENRVDEEGLTADWIDRTRKQLHKMRPVDARTLRRYRQVMSAGLRSAIGIPGHPGEDLAETWLGQSKAGSGMVRRGYIGWRDAGERIPVTEFRPAGKPRGAVLVVHPDGRTALTTDNEKAPGHLIQQLTGRGQTVLTCDVFLTGAAEGVMDASFAYHTTYNRTVTANRVRDIITSAVFLRRHSGFSSVCLVGIGAAGPWSLLACGLYPQIVRAVIDLDRFEVDSDEAYQEKLFIPLLRRLGGLPTAAALATPADLFLHNTGPALDADDTEAAYRAAGAKERLRTQREPADSRQIVDWAVEGPEK